MSAGSYWGLPEKTEESFFAGGWFRPNDIGYIDDDGFLYYLDRAKDRITTAAGVVYPHVVEAVLLRHPSVSNCGVVGLGGCRQRWAWARWPTSWLASQLPRSRTELAVPRMVPLRIQSVSVRPSTSAIVSARVARNAVRSASPDMCS